jgi:hypothetical protein
MTHCPIDCATIQTFGMLESHTTPSIIRAPGAEEVHQYRDNLLLISPPT